MEIKKIIFELMKEIRNSKTLQELFDIQDKYVEIIGKQICVIDDCEFRGL